MLVGWPNLLTLHTQPTAGAFRKLVAGEVQQLRGLLAHQAAAQLSGTIQLLDGPIAAAGSSSSSPISAKAAPHNSRQQRTCSTDAASLPALSAASADTGLGGASDVGTAGSDVCGAPGGSLLAAAAAAVAAGSSSSSGGGGPSADELVRDYAEAYASMKETMEVRLRHEQRRCDFLQVRAEAAVVAAGLRRHGMQGGRGGLWHCRAVEWWCACAHTCFFFNTGQVAAARGVTLRHIQAAGSGQQVRWGHKQQPDTPCVY